MIQSNRILIIDDDPDFAVKMRLAFKHLHFDGALSGEEGTKLLRGRQYELVLLDLNLSPEVPGLDGLKLIGPIKSEFAMTPMIVVTADNRTETVVSAMKLGADDFLRKSEFDILSWGRKFELLIENKALSQRLSDMEEERFPFLGNCDKIQEIKRTLRVLAEEQNASLLIIGETGVGKEVAARYLYHHSPRKGKPFVTVNLPAIPDTLMESTLFGYRKGAFTGADSDQIGLFKQADTGILFLDEMGEINQSLQLKLLRFLDSKIIQAVGDDKEVELDVQIIAATNRNSLELVNSGQLRQDLYYRLKHMTLEIPPLRERGDDLRKLLVYYLERAGYRSVNDILDSTVYRRLLKYDWPGNVRELKNTVDSMLLRSRVLKKTKVDESCLPAEMGRENRLESNLPNNKQLKFLPAELDKSVAVTELKAIESALNETYGQKQAAAQLLGINMDQMRYRVMKFWDQFPDLVLKHPVITTRYKLSKEGRNGLEDK